MDDLVLECYMKLFYANLNAKRESDSLKIYLKGREVEVSTSLLNQILGVPDEGELVTPKKGDLGIEEYNSAKWISLISNGKSKTTLKGDMLSRNKKVLLYIISQIIFPKQRGLSNVNGFEAFLM